MTATLIGVHHTACCWRFIAWQMVIGHQDLDAKGVRFSHPLHAGDPIINRDNDVWFLLGGQQDNFRGESVTILKSIGHQVINGCPHAF